MQSSLKKVISGGQWGADITGILAAANAGLETGGYAPAKYQTIGGPFPELAGFGLVDSGLGYVGRTELNIQNSDGTIILVYDPTSPGTKTARQFLQKHQKPFLMVDLNEMDSEFHRKTSIKHCLDFIVKNQVQTLNIAGNRKYEGFLDRTIHQFLLDIFAILGYTTVNNKKNSIQE